MLVGCVRRLLSQWKIGIQISQRLFEGQSLEKSRQSQEQEQGVEALNCAARCNVLEEEKRCRSSECAVVFGGCYSEGSMS